MPEKLILNNIGFKGLATDLNSWSLPPEFITAGNNFKVYAGSIENRGGSKLWSIAPVNFNPGYLAHVGSTIDDLWIVPGRSAVYAFDGFNWFDISSTEGYAGLGVDDELLWTSSLLGRITIINNSKLFPEYWDPPVSTQILQPLTFDGTSDWKAKDFSAKVFRSHKNFLFALNLREGLVDFPDSYRWSHPADINGLPATWDETDDSFLAGKAALGGDGGQIIDGRSLRDAFCIYSETGIDILDYTNDEFVWRRRELSSSYGLLSKNSIAEVKGVHYFLSNGDIFRNDGNKISSIVHNRIKRQFSEAIGFANYTRSYAVVDSISKEIWFCIASSQADYPDTAFVYNWLDSSWAVRELPDNIALSSYGSYQPIDQSWDEIDGNWMDQNRSWLSSASSPLSKLLFGVDPVAGLLRFITLDDIPDDDFNASIERTNFPLGDDVQVTTITRVYPHVGGQGLINIQFGSHDYPGSPIRWKSPVVFDPAVDRKIDVRTTGELHAWRFSSIGKSTWSMSGFTIEYEKAGYR